MDIKEKERINHMLEIENDLKKKGYKIIAGVDEAGRGPLCGPVVVASVVLPENITIEGINDSKKLSEKKREILYEQIINEAVEYCVDFVDVDVIENINILNATKLGMKNVVNNLKIKPDFVLIDGNQDIDVTTDRMTVVGGDAKSLSIAAASIVAKVTRDRLLREYDEKYPMYGFKNNKGYGTKAHIEAIKKYGICEIHRKSFCKKFINEK